MRYSISNAIPHNPKSEKHPYENLVKGGYLRFYTLPGLEPTQMQMSGGHLLPPVQKLVAQSVKKASQSLPPQRQIKSKTIFCRGVYLTENTSQAACVRVVRHRRTRSALSRLQSFRRKAPKGFFDGLCHQFKNWWLPYLPQSGKAIESCCPHQTNIIRTKSSLWETGSDYLFSLVDLRKPISETVSSNDQNPSPEVPEKRNRFRRMLL